jgi:hypothetical protein
LLRRRFIGQSSFYGEGLSGKAPCCNEGLLGKAACCDEGLSGKALCCDGCLSGKVAAYMFTTSTKVNQGQKKRTDSVLAEQFGLTEQLGLAD